MARKTNTSLATRSRQSNGTSDTTYQSSGDTINDDDSSMTNDMPDQHTPGTDAAANGMNGDGFQLGASSSTALESIYHEPAKLFDAINDIGLLGLEISQRRLELPRIVTIGDQSAGKSSAIAAISGITVPRKSGICTRCPSHINLSKSKPGEAWSCTVSLQKDFVHPNRSWQPQNPELIPLVKLSSSEDLQAALERAQKAALNPQIDPVLLMQCRDADLPAKDLTYLSPNLVRLDIRGVSCPNLTFFDLPGIFNQTANENDRHLVSDVHRLVKGYMQSENNILLLACAMENDLENSTAAKLVRESKCEQRCIGLLTKADRLPPGSAVDPWLEVLRNRNFRLGHGYFVTKQPDQLQLDQGVSHDEARAMEDRYFKSTPPWNTAYSQHQSQFGIPRLQAKLSILLVEHIRKCLPRLREDCETELARVESRLAGLPTPPGEDAQSTVLSMLNDFKNGLDVHMRGDLPHNEFIREWARENCEGFRKDLHMMRPMLVIKTQEEIEQQRNVIAMMEPQDDVIALDDEDPVQAGRKRQASSMSQTSPSKRSKHESFQGSSNSSFGQGMQPITNSRSLPVRTSVGPNNIYPYSRAPELKLETVRQVREQMNTSAIIGTSDHRAGEHLIQEAVKYWDQPLQKFIETTTSKLNETAQQICRELTMQWESTKFFDELPAMIANFLDDVSEKHRQFAMHLLEAEKLKPASLNPTIHANEAQETRIFREGRQRWRASMWVDKDEVSKKKKIPTSGEDREDKLKKVTEAQLGPDEYAAELETMGRVRGYYNVASASLVDTMVKLQRLDLFEHTRKHLVKHIQTELGVLGAHGFERCKELLMESKERAEEREMLLKQQDKFRQAKTKLDALFNPRR